MNDTTNPAGGPTLWRRWHVLPWLMVVALAAGCAARNVHRAPVEERTPSKPAGTTPVPSGPAATPGAATPAPVAPGTAEAGPARPSLPLSEHAGKPGYYTVKAGDTLIRIGLETGQNWRDIARWSNLENVNVIEVGQVLRVAPPVADPGPAGPRPVAGGNVETRPLDGRPPAPGAAAASGAAAGPAAPVAPLPAREGDDDVTWSWPAAGAVASGFDEARNKGVLITGKAGDPVLAAADGRVVYAGSGLRGYGNLVIVKHNNTYLTAYAHNRTLLVKEDQAVRRGQRIAEMGSTDADRVQLHFEVRRLGKPIDPARVLPPR